MWEWEPAPVSASPGWWRKLNKAHISPTAIGAQSAGHDGYYSNPPSVMPDMTKVLKVGWLDGCLPRSFLQGPSLGHPRRELTQDVGSELHLSSSSYLQAYLFWTFREKTDIWNHKNWKINWKISLARQLQSGSWKLQRSQLIVIRLKILLRISYHSKCAIERTTPPV